MPLGITRNLESWRFQDQYVERVMDNAAYTSAHPDDTLVLAGPARLSTVQTASTSGNSIQSLLAIGMLQNVAFSQTKNTTPVMAIGSGRSFFVSGKAQGQGQMQRLFVNGRNLLRVLYHNARAANLPVGDLDDPAARSSESQFYINLDSELYLIPFGLGTIFRTKAHDFVGGFYSELTMIQNYQVSFQAGGNQIAEAVNFMFDRLMPFGEDTVVRTIVARATLDSVIGFIDNTNTDVRTEFLASSTVATSVGT
jgi:hypothetical protein